MIGSAATVALFIYKALKVGSQDMIDLPKNGFILFCFNEMYLGLPIGVDCTQSSPDSAASTLLFAQKARAALCLESWILSLGNQYSFCFTLQLEDQHSLAQKHLKPF